MKREPRAKKRKPKNGGNDKGWLKK